MNWKFDQGATSTNAMLSPPLLVCMHQSVERTYYKWYFENVLLELGFVACVKVIEVG
jgi:hypothetical protein